MLQRAASNGREISREDFYNIMTKKAFWLALFMITYVLTLSMIRYQGRKQKIMTK
jgi:preprotein translocase subunit SecG